MRLTIYPETIDIIAAEYRRGEKERAAEAAWWRADGLPFAGVVDRVWATLPMHAGSATPISGASRRPPSPPENSPCMQSASACKPRLIFSPWCSWLKAFFKPIRTRIGARRLAGGRLAREDAWGIQRYNVPEGLRHLSTYEIEDILCLYKDELLLTPAQFLALSSTHVPSGCGSTFEQRSSC